jgi:GNAT superfamily N-acetyltransferase
LSQPHSAAKPAIVLREPRVGDMGWVVAQHGLIYHREYGWKNFQPAWERGWIAELNGERVGCAFVVKAGEHTAKLRMLLLTPQARGLGLGARLADECIAFARAKGYQTMVLWTNSILAAARHIYVQRGFVLTASEAYEGFGQQLVSETWELVL